MLIAVKLVTFPHPMRVNDRPRGSWRMKFGILCTLGLSYPKYAYQCTPSEWGSVIGSSIDVIWERR